MPDPHPVDAPTPAPEPDTRIVHGSACTYWGPIQSASRTRLDGLPGCPFCNRVLFEMKDEATFLSYAEQYEQAGNPGYVIFIKWLKGRRCYRTIETAMAIYAMRN